MGSRPPYPSYSPLIIPGFPPPILDQKSTMCVPPKKRILSSKPRKISPVSHSVSSMLGNVGSSAAGKQKTTLQPVSVDPHTGKTRLPKLTIHKEAYPCPHCDRIFSSMSGRFYHMPVHTGQYTYRCPDCQQGFMELSKFRRHMIKKHDREYTGSWLLTHIENLEFFKYHGTEYSKTTFF